MRAHIFLCIFVKMPFSPLRVYCTFEVRMSSTGIPTILPLSALTFFFRRLGVDRRAARHEHASERAGELEGGEDWAA